METQLYKKVTLYFLSTRLTSGVYTVQCSLYLQLTLLKRSSASILPVPLRDDILTLACPPWKCRHLITTPRSNRHC